MQKIREQVHLYILGVLFIATCLIWYAVFREDRAGVLTVAFLNVGQGDGIFIESPTSNQIMIDGGPDGSVLRELGSVMPFYDRSLDMLIVSNPDQDHFGGFIDILKSYAVDSVVEPGTVGASSEYSLLEKEIVDKDITHMLARRGQKILIGGGAEVDILFPDRDVSGMATNDGSIVAKLVYGNTSVLLTGDSPQNIEHYLSANDGKNLKSTILKIGHHGSRTSTSAELVGFVAPSYAVISDGKGNTYGHPHKETLDTLAQFDVPVLRTDLLGAIIFTSDGNEFRQK